MAHIDQLLEEYLRVINDKDDEIHRLIKRTEDARNEQKKKEEQYRVRLRTVKGDLTKRESELQELRTFADESEATITKLTTHSDGLKKDLQAASAARCSAR